MKEKVSGSLQHAEDTRSAMLELLQREEPAALRSALAAFAAKQQDHLNWIQVRMQFSSESVDWHTITLSRISSSDILIGLSR